MYRRVLNARGALPETDFLSDEENIVTEAKEWSLHRTPNDRLSALELLAGLQHQGVPTRLLDFSHNALVALWFAVEQRFDDTGQPLPDIDGRVFVAQSNGREVNPAWERAPDLPVERQPARRLAQGHLHLDATPYRPTHGSAAGLLRVRRSAINHRRLERAGWKRFSSDARRRDPRMCFGSYPSKQHSLCPP